MTVRFVNKPDSHYGKEVEKEGQLDRLEASVPGKYLWVTNAAFTMNESLILSISGRVRACRVESSYIKTCQTCSFD